MPAVDLTPYNQPQGSTSDGSKFDNLLASLQSTLNGLDNNNFAAGKIFDPSKLMQNSAVDGDGLVYDSAAGIWKRTTDKPLRIAALAGYPADGTKVLKGDGTWGTASGPTSYRKTTAKAVNTTVSATDLLNAEITLAANDLGTSKHLRAVLIGDWLNNAGGNPPRFQVVVGGTTVLDTNVPSSAPTTSASRFGWQLVIECLELGATNSQLWSATLDLAANAGGSGSTVAFTTGTGSYYDVYNGAAIAAYRAHGMGTSALDDTSSKTFVVNVINGFNSVSYETKLYGAAVDIA